MTAAQQALDWQQAGKAPRRAFFLTPFRDADLGSLQAPRGQAEDDVLCKRHAAQMWEQISEVGAGSTASAQAPFI